MKYTLLILTCLLVGCSTNIENRSIEIPFEFNVSVPVFPDYEINIKDLGATSDNNYNNAFLINEAIRKVSMSGGGKVIVPQGEWHTSTIKMKSHVNLHLEEGAVLSFSDRKYDYLPPVFTRFEGIECKNYSSLIYAIGCENIAITGKGKLIGNGEKWWSWKKKQKMTLNKLYDMVIDSIPPNERLMAVSEPLSYLRPSFIQFIDCKNVLLSDYTISDGPMWTNHLVYCKNVTAKNLQVITQGVNNDGLVIDSSEDVLVDNCFFSTGDDCVVIKSGLNEDGWRVGRPTKNVVVRNCRTEKGHGGVVIGSEMSGGIENILAYDCHFSNTGRGLRIKSMRGRGGYVKNIYFRDIQMDSIKGEAIKVNMRYASSSVPPRGDKTPVFGNINIKNVTTKYARVGLSMQGLSNQPIEGIHISNFTCESAKYGIVMDSSAMINLNDVSINAIEKPVRRFVGNQDIATDNLILDGENVGVSQLQDMGVSNDI